MIVGFSRHSTGGGSGPVAYLTRTIHPDGSARAPAPEVVRGEPELVRRLIDALRFARTYVSGVLSFAPGESITPAMEHAIMDGFERVAFAGLAPERYSILWVRHQHAGHHELHFVTPRVELASGKSLNIHPPGRASTMLFDTFRSMVNAEYGLADPDDPARARDVSLPHHLAKRRAESARKGKALKEDTRQAITAFIRREMDAGRIKDRQGVETYLQAQGIALTRSGADSITILDPETGERVRLKGGLYSREGFKTGATAGERVRYGTPDPDRALTLAAKLEPMTEARATFHRQRYGVQEQGEEEHAPEHGIESLRKYVARHLGEDALREVWASRRVLCLQSRASTLSPQSSIL